MPDTPTCPKCEKAQIEGCVDGYIQVGQSECPVHQGKRTSEVCDLCDGSGWVLPPKAPCRNMRARMMRQHLGPELASVQHVRSSPLLELGPDGPVTDLTRKNVFIRGAYWHDLLPHLKWALSYHGLSFFFTIINDERIKNVFVGNEDFRHRSKEVRHHMPTFNGLRDLVGKDIDLLIIRLGFLGHKNVAAAGALREALMIREGLRKATWLVEEPHRSWRHAYDGELAHYINHTFQEVSFGEGTGLGISTDDDDEPEEGDELEMQPFQQQSPIFDVAEDVDEEVEDVDVEDLDLGALGLGDEPSWKKKSKKRGGW